MGVRDVIGRDPADLIRELLGNPVEQQRRRRAHRRTCLYREDGERIIKEEIAQIFEDPNVRDRLGRFARVAGGSQSIFRRVVDLWARPTYATPPVRRVTPASAQAAYDQVVLGARLNKRMDLALRLTDACTAVALFGRYVERHQKIVVDILTPDMVTVVADPDVPTEALAVAYDRPVLYREGWKTHIVYWDDVETFELDAERYIVKGSQRAHGHRRMPFTWMHRRERWGGFWEATDGNALESAHLQTVLLNMLAMRLLKAQGFNTLFFQTDDLSQLPKGMTLDEEGAMVGGADTSVQPLQLKTDADHYLRMLDAVKVDAAANRGVSRARLNEDEAQGSSDVGLQEERAEGMQIAYAAEQDLFDVLKMLSAESDAPIPDDATLELDFGDLASRTDRLKELEILTQEWNRGLRPMLAEVKRMNPEIRDDAGAFDRFLENITSNSRLNEIVASRNMSQGGGPARTPEQNGAMGPAVRDGKMSGDQAAQAARQPAKPTKMDPKQLRELARRIAAEAA